MANKFLYQHKSHIMSFMPVRIIFVTKEIGAKIFRCPCENIHPSNGSLAPKSQEHNPLYIGDLN